MRGSRVKYLKVTLWSVFLGVAALLSYAISSYDIPVSILVSSCVFSACAVLLPGLRIDSQTAGIVVGCHHHDPRPHHRQQREDTATYRGPRSGVVYRDTAEGAEDVAAMCPVEGESPIRSRAERRLHDAVSTREARTRTR